MSTERERSVTEAFVLLADSLVGVFDVVDLLNSLTEICARLLDVASAGLLLADSSGILHVIAASSEETRTLELFQLQRDEGPCLDCFRTGKAVRIPDLQNQAGRWPQFVAAAASRGLVSVHAVPMQLEKKVLGSLGLFGASVGTLNDDDLNLGQALAHVASVALVSGNATADQERLSQQLQTALNSRVFIEQAKGVIAEFAHVSMDEAFSVLRKYSRDRNLKLTEVAQGVATRILPIQELVSLRQSSRPQGPTA